MRNLRLKGAHTLSFPGATTLDIMDKFPDIIKSHPEAHKIIIHAGTNDIPEQQSELLKQDFLRLFNTVKQSHRSVLISGPTPTCGQGIGRFSKLFSLNTWLSSVCDSHSMGFIDNFNVFWDRRHLFRTTGST